MPPLVRRTLLSSCSLSASRWRWLPSPTRATAASRRVTPHSPNAERIDDSRTSGSRSSRRRLRRRREHAPPVHLPLPPRGRPRDGGGPAGPRRDAPGADLDRDSRVDPRRDRGVRLLQAARDPGRPEREGGRRTARRSRMDAHQFYWQFTYPNGAVSIDELHAPVNRVVTGRHRLAGRRPQLVDSRAAAGSSTPFPAIATNDTWFKADQVGTYRGQCGEFCGVYHARWNAPSRSRAEPDEYESYLASLGQARSISAGRSGRRLREVSRHWTAHGGYGPAIKNNSTSDPAGGPAHAAHAAAQPARSRSRTYMPPVARGWTDKQVNALLRLSEAQRLQGVGEWRLEPSRSPRTAPTGARAASMSWITTVDHKRIGILYLVTSLVFFAAGGILALLMRSQLATRERALRHEELLQRALHDPRHDDDLSVHRPVLGRASRTSSCR